MITVDGHFFDTEYKWQKYCKENNIKDPFKERIDKVKLQRKVINGLECWEGEWDRSPEAQAREEEWKKRRDEYLRLENTFRLWDMHFWIDDWDEFQTMGEGGYVDMSIYLPCDIASRQCSMRCEYFGKECLRDREELKCPIPGLEDRYEI